MKSLEQQNDFSHVVVILAALNEQDGIKFSLAELKTILIDPLFLVVDGRSEDKTVKIAKDMGAQVLVQKEFGKGAGIAEAIGHIKSDPKYVVFIDADYSYPARPIPEMIQILEKNPDVGMVTGNRFNSYYKSTGMKSIFFLGNKMLSAAQRLLNGFYLQDPLTGLRVVRWKILKNWKPKSQGFDIEVEMNHYVEKKRYKIIEFPIVFRNRVGKKKLKPTDGFTILLRMINELFQN